MIKFEDIEVYLPKYLSVQSQQKLFDELKGFPKNIDNRLYTNKLANTDIIYQGDGINGLLMVNLPDSKIFYAKGMVLSNTCDVDTSNNRYFPSRIVYCPIFSLNKYKLGLVQENIYTAQQVEDHVLAIKKQYITQIFFLPAAGQLTEDSIVYFDTAINCFNEAVNRSSLNSQRIFTLSDYGLYLFLFKLSLHFTRIQEAVDRG